MAKVYQRPEIEAAITPEAAIQAVEAGFVAYSQKRVVVPSVGSLVFKNPPGDVHIKYGYREGAPTFVIKIAGSFYDNPKRGLSSSSGLMLVFDARTGFPEAILLDEGYLTDLRTAAAGAIAAKYLGPKIVTAIGILGAGVQAHFQLDLLRHVCPCRRAIVWARDPEKAGNFKVEGFQIEAAGSVEELLSRCNLVVTTTPSERPLIWEKDVRPGTHITAVGADGFGKQELDPALIARADIRVVDSRSQCFDYGDSSHALKEKRVTEDQFLELGEVIAKPALGRTSDTQVTVADLTGVAVQDIQIADAVYARLRQV